MLQELSALAPVVSVRGNSDGGEWARGLPRQEVVELGGVLVALVHDLATLDLIPEAAGIRAVVYGHSHRPALERRGSVLYVNPGSAGPRRFALPVTVARLLIFEGEVVGDVRHLALGPLGGTARRAGA